MVTVCLPSYLGKYSLWKGTSECPNYLWPQINVRSGPNCVVGKGNSNVCLYLCYFNQKMFIFKMETATYVKNIKLHQL